MVVQDVVRAQKRDNALYYIYRSRGAASETSLACCPGRYRSAGRRKRKPAVARAMDKTETAAKYGDGGIWGTEYRASRFSQHALNLVTSAEKHMPAESPRSRVGAS